MFTLFCMQNCTFDARTSYSLLWGLEYTVFLFVSISYILCMGNHMRWLSIHCIMLGWMIVGWECYIQDCSVDQEEYSRRGDGMFYNSGGVGLNASKSSILLHGFFNQ